ncbi:MAG: ATP-binding protein [Armatimonadota bacterium]
MKIFRSIRWKLTFVYLIAALASISALGFYLSQWTDRFYETSLRNDLASECRFIGSLSEPLMKANPSAINNLARDAGKQLQRRITIIRSDGKVLGDSISDISKMESHNNRPEVKAALAAGYGWSIRYSSTLKTRMLYAAVKFGSSPDSSGVARISESLELVESARRNINYVFFIAALIAFLIAAILSVVISHNITGPIKEMSETAHRFAKGELNRKIRVHGKPGDEIDGLALALNGMASDLQRAMNELSAEKSKLQTILDKTDDGLLVIDRESRIRMANPAAARILGTGTRQISGMTIIECTLSHDLAELVERVFRTEGSASLEIQLLTPPQTYLNVYAAYLELPKGTPGAVVVMHDITDAKSMDSIRRDFVANVSHELRTPLASIKAMAETISLRGKKDPAMIEDYAGKIVTEADRLTSISDDLLDLAKIEAGRRTIGTEVFNLTEVVSGVLTQLHPRADHKAITLISEIPDDQQVDADREAVYQIVTNLVDNAVKYTTPGGTVRISAVDDDEEHIAVSISDTGVGIPPADLPRIFERFYRVDKARSRESGGTGLGLSIVKHLVEAHGCRITVTSIPGKGSTFTFTLPKP